MHMLISSSRGDCPYVYICYLLLINQRWTTLTHTYPLMSHVYGVPFFFEERSCHSPSPSKREWMIVLLFYQNTEGYCSSLLKKKKTRMDWHHSFIHSRCDKEEEGDAFDRRLVLLLLQVVVVVVTWDYYCHGFHAGFEEEMKKKNAIRWWHCSSLPCHDLSFLPSSIEYNHFTSIKKKNGWMDAMGEGLWDVLKRWWWFDRNMQLLQLISSLLSWFNKYMNE